MTKDEAIMILKDCELNPCVPKDKEAADMAIKALKQQTCEDCINRATVLELINDVKRVDGFKEYAQYEYLFNQVDKMPSVQPQPSNDCISRTEAIKGLGEQPLAWTDSNSEIQQLLDWREHKEMLEKLPSVGQKVGHWIVEIWNNREHHTCSECQRMVDYEPCYHYCPYCGAKLSEVEE